MDEFIPTMVPPEPEIKTELFTIKAAMVVRALRGEHLNWKLKSSPEQVIENAVQGQDPIAIMEVARYLNLKGGAELDGFLQQIPVEKWLHHELLGSAIMVLPWSPNEALARLGSLLAARPDSKIDLKSRISSWSTAEPELYKLLTETFPEVK